MGAVFGWRADGGYFSSELGHRGHQQFGTTDNADESELDVKRIFALIAVSSALLLVGCSQVGVAASVGSTKITQATVQKSIDTVLAERAKIDTSTMQLETGAALNRSQLRFHLMAALLSDVVADQTPKITVTKAEIDAYRASILTQVGGAAQLPKALVNAGIASIDLDAYIQLIIMSNKLTKEEVAAGIAAANTGLEIQKKIIAMAGKEKVTINPRYGKWDSTTGDIVVADVASPAATPAKTP